MKTTNCLILLQEFEENANKQTNISKISFASTINNCVMLKKRWKQTTVNSCFGANHVIQHVLKLE